MHRRHTEGTELQSFSGKNTPAKAGVMAQCQPRRREAAVPSRPQTPPGKVKEAAKCVVMHAPCYTRVWHTAGMGAASDWGQGRQVRRSLSLN